MTEQCCSNVVIAIDNGLAIAYIRCMLFLLRLVNFEALAEYRVGAEYRSDVVIERPYVAYIGSSDRAAMTPHILPASICRYCLRWNILVFKSLMWAANVS